MTLPTEFGLQRFEGETARQFQAEITIHGLPLVFEGVIPEKVGVFSWTLRIRDWETMQDEVHRYLAHRAVQIHPRLHFASRGEVAKLEMEDVGELGENAALVSYIQTIDPENFPNGNPYTQLTGAGSFLMNNLCALADIKRWNLYAGPAGAGKLSTSQIRDWTMRRGFTDIGYPGYAPMRRLPQQPDETQLIARIVRPTSLRSS
ncbi:MAG: hypothetical protein KGJ07_04940 [Patescibacteria group bacterium]|nr:hypothetical protein [Patescibacteria group bacterium]